MQILIVIILMAALGLVFGLVLGFFSKKFAVKIDPRIEKVNELLPGANCGACGYAGCSGLAEVIVNEEVDPALCTPGGEETAENICKYLGREAGKVEKKVAVILCNGSAEKAPLKYEYHGEQDCVAANMLHSGPKECSYGCMALYSCKTVCPFDAVEIAEDGLPSIINDKCVACGKCVDACPKDLIIIEPEKKKVHIKCCSKDKGAVVNKVCKVGCIGCTKCVKDCPVDAISMDGTLAKIDYEKCIVCGKCVKACPKGAIINEKTKKSE